MLRCGIIKILECLFIWRVAFSVQELQLLQHGCICYLDKSHKDKSSDRVSYLKLWIYFGTMNAIPITTVLWLAGVKSPCVDMV